MSEHKPLPVYDPNDPRMPPSLPLFLAVSQVGRRLRSGAGIAGLLLAGFISYTKQETLAEIGTHMVISGLLAFMATWGGWLAVVSSIRRDVVNDLDALRHGATQSEVESE